MVGSDIPPSEKKPGPKGKNGAAASADDYGADSFQKLEYPENVRKRPGSTSPLLPSTSKNASIVAGAGMSDPLARG